MKGEKGRKKVKMKENERKVSEEEAVGRKKNEKKK